LSRAAERLSIFHPEFLVDLRHWVKTDGNTALRVLDLVEATVRDPFQGIGKPELLRYLRGCWSRRITEEHRLVYRGQQRPDRFLAGTISLLSGRAKRGECRSYMAAES